MRIKRVVIIGLCLVLVAGIARLVLSQALSRQISARNAALVAAGNGGGGPGGQSGNPALPDAQSGAAPPTPKQVQYSDVKKQVEQAVKAQPKSHAMRMEAAKFYMQANDFRSALPHLEQAVKLDGKQFLGWLALGDCATLAGKPARAEEAYTRASALDSRNPLVFRGRGQLYLAQEKFKQAQTVLEAGLKLNPNDQDLRTALGNVYLIVNKNRLAAETLKPAVDAMPGRADLRFLLGEAYARDLSLEKSVVEMKAATEIEPRMDTAWGKMGLYLNSLTRYDEARAALEKAVALDPKNPYYQWALGDTYVLKETDPAAIQKGMDYYEQALKLDPRHEKALYAYGMALTRRGSSDDLTKAVRLLEQLVKVNPVDTNGYFKLAETYRRLGKTKEAAARSARFRELFEKGRKQTRDLHASVSFVDTAEAHVKLGRRYLEQNKPDLAAKEFEFALTREPNLAVAKEGLAEARERSQGAPRTSRQGSTP